TGLTIRPCLDGPLPIPTHLCVLYRLRSDWMGRLHPVRDHQRPQYGALRNDWSYFCQLPQKADWSLAHDKWPPRVEHPCGFQEWALLSSFCSVTLANPLFLKRHYFFCSAGSGTGKSELYVSTMHFHFPSACFFQISTSFPVS